MWLLRTIFLDEIGNLSYDVQVQLLRALEERKVKPVGSDKEIAFDVRIISATNENLTKAVAEGNFREDLYHRLNEFSLKALSLDSTLSNNFWPFSVLTNTRLVPFLSFKSGA